MNDNEAGDASNLALKRLLTALVSAAVVSDPELQAEARNSGMEAQRSLTALAGATPDHPRHLDDLWVLAVEAAEKDRRVRREEDVNPMLQRICPFDLHDLSGPQFDFDAASQQIREITSSG